jgi:two-component sensor histidine kinase
LEPDVAQAIAVILHELATNAVKYGALSVGGAQIDLKWFETDGRLNLRWSETGGPAIERPTRKGLGSQIIERMIAQLRGKVSFDWRPEGLVCELSFPVV